MLSSFYQIFVRGKIFTRPLYVSFIFPHVLAFNCSIQIYIKGQNLLFLWVKSHDYSLISSHIKKLNLDSFTFIKIHISFFMI